MLRSWNIGDKVKIPYPGRCYLFATVVFEELNFKNKISNKAGDYSKVKDQVWEIFGFSKRKIGLCGVRSLTTGQELLVNMEDLLDFDLHIVSHSIEDLIYTINLELCQ